MAAAGSPLRARLRRARPLAKPLLLMPAGWRPLLAGDAVRRAKSHPRPAAGQRFVHEQDGAPCRSAPPPSAGRPAGKERDGGQSKRREKRQGQRQEDTKEVGDCPVYLQKNCLIRIFVTQNATRYVHCIYGRAFCAGPARKCQMFKCQMPNGQWQFVRTWFYTVDTCSIVCREIVTRHNQLWR